MKHTFSRRLGALLLTFALTLTLVVPAWAVDGNTLAVTLAGDSNVKTYNNGQTIQNGIVVGLHAEVNGVSTGLNDQYDFIWTEDDADDAVDWSVNTSSSDVNHNQGSITGKKLGTATIKVTVSEKNPSSGATPKTGTAEFTVTVVPRLTIDQASLTVQAENTANLTATLDPVSNTYPITWSSADDTIATVGANGTVTGVKAGETTISASCGGFTETCAVTVTAAPPSNVSVTGVALDKTSLTLTAGEKETLTATVAPENATNKNVTWRSSNTDVATVNNGTVTAVKAGNTTITVTTEDSKKTATCTVTVNPAAAGGVYITQFTEDNPLILDLNKTGQLVASVSPPGANQGVNWSSEDGTVATVDSDGNVTAKGVGRTIITASAGGYSATCAVEVSGVVLETDKIQSTMYLNKTQTVSIQSYGNASKGTTRRTWVSSHPAIASVDSTGKILARSYGTARISLTYTANGVRYPVVNDSFEVTVVEDTGAIYFGSATAGAPYVFTDIMSDLNRICRNTTEKGSGLSYITNIQVPTSEGVLYYNHVSSDDTGFGVGSTEYYYYDENTVGQRYMSGLTFVPNSDFNGETTITYTGYSTQGERYSGKIRLTVSGSGNVTFITKAGQPLTFTSTGFSAACRSETGREINSAFFTLPEASKGTLYYGVVSAGEYRYEVTEQEEYFRSRTPYLDQVGFVPAEYYIGTLRLPFRGTDTAGVSFTGRLYIIVVPNRPEGERSELTTTVPRGSTVDFGKFDFNAVSRQILGETLSYVRFTPPSSSTGTLYYNYTSSGRYDSLVNANTRYYYSRSPKLEDLTFVPSFNRIEPVSINFVGYSTSGKSFDGTVTIYFRDADGGDDVIHYAVTSGQAIPFEPADFNDLCQSATSQDLSRIVFRYLPDTSEGTLYYNYNSGSSTGTKVTTKTNLYRSSLSGVAFAPKSDYVGTVSLEFDGYATNGARFTGTVRIEVEEGNTTLRYSVPSGSSVTFDGDDFNTICRQATDGKLNYVRFQLPKATEGKLYCRYNSSSTSKSSVSTSTSYYYSSTGSNRLDNVFFTAEPNFIGTVSIDYTGFSTSGARFTGTVQIDVSYHSGTVLSYSTDALPFTIPGSELTSACNSALERDLSYIVFNTLPKAEQGRLYYDYVGYGTGTEVKTSTKYYPSKQPYLDRLVFVPKAGYEGTVSLPYTAYDTRGSSISGSVDIRVTQATTSVFVDMARYLWAIPSVDFLYASGIVKGTGSNRFDPVSQVRRCDFVVMLARMYNFRAAGTKSFDDVREDQFYSAAIASAKAQNVITGENGLFRPEEPITREDAMVFLYNAMRAANKTVPSGSASELYTFADYNSVSPSARNAMISMIHMGILTGDDYRRLNPTSPMTRAETATLMHRAMTL